MKNLFYTIFVLLLFGTTEIFSQDVCTYESAEKKLRSYLEELILSPEKYPEIPNNVPALKALLEDWPDATRARQLLDENSRAPFCVIETCSAYFGKKPLISFNLAKLKYIPPLLELLAYSDGSRAVPSIGKTEDEKLLMKSIVVRLEYFNSLKKILESDKKPTGTECGEIVLNLNNLVNWLMRANIIKHLKQEDIMLVFSQLNALFPIIEKESLAQSLIPLAFSQELPDKSDNTSNALRKQFDRDVPIFLRLALLRAPDAFTDLYCDWIATNLSMLTNPDALKIAIEETEGTREFLDRCKYLQKSIKKKLEEIPFQVEGASNDEESNNEKLMLAHEKIVPQLREILGIPAFEEPPSIENIVQVFKDRIRSRERAFTSKETRMKLEAIEKALDLLTQQVVLLEMTRDVVEKLEDEK